MACTTFLALESIHRYLSIGHGWTVSTRTEDNMIIGAWTWAITSIAVARLVSWIKPGMYDWGYKNEMWCGIRHDSQPALAALIGVMVIPPLLILVFCYTSIYLHVRKVLKDEASILTGRRKYQYKCAKTMGAYVATFLASWSGIMLLWVVCGLTGKEPLWWQETAVTTLAHLSGVFSFIQVTIANWDRAGSPDALTFPLT
ncbi:hypothetical protein DFJ77DRAFT_448344 [Powellomyces hirtus]|nr:hypothetical protein DFJ77DRAFT_448344 [Powellomyces hirtus]